MTLAFEILLAWTLVSSPMAILAGRWIKAGSP